jgi:hypothetical protein
MIVFGSIALPIPELLFIYTLLLVLGIVIVLVEIRRLRKLILTEQADIYKFETDIDKTTPKEKEKHSKSLEEFIKASVEKGLTRTEIEEILTKKGWPKQLVDEVFARYKK